MICRHDPTIVQPDPNIYLEDDLEIDPNLRMKRIKNVDLFKYLGMLIADKWDNMEAEIKKRLNIATAAFAEKSKYFYKDSVYDSGIRIQFIRDTIIPKLIYGIEIWNLKPDNISRLDQWLRRKLNSILHFKETDRIPLWCTLQYLLANNVVCYPISLLMVARRLKYFGNVARMEDWRLPKMVHFGAVVDHTEKNRTKCLPGINHRCNLLIRDLLHKDLKYFDIPYEEFHMCQHKLYWDLLIDTQLDKTFKIWLKFEMLQSKYRKHERFIITCNILPGGIEEDEGVGLNDEVVEIVRSKKQQRRINYRNRRLTMPLSRSVPRDWKKDSQAIYKNNELDDYRKLPFFESKGLFKSGYYRAINSFKRAVKRSQNGIPPDFPNDRTNFYFQNQRLGLPIKQFTRKWIKKFTENFQNSRAMKQISWEEEKTAEIIAKHRKKVDIIITNRNNPEEDDERIAELRERGLWCNGIVKSGPNKGKFCDSPSINNTIYCGRHRNLNIVEPDDDPVIDEPVVAIVEDEIAGDNTRPQCEAITKNKKTRCTNHISVKDIALGITRYCGTHKALRS